MTQRSAPAGLRRTTASRTTPQAPAAPVRRTQAAELLALQRTAGNTAARALLARRPAATPAAPGTAAAPTFRVLIVDDGKSGLSADTLKRALDHVRADLAKLTSASANPLVKAGVSVEYRDKNPERGTDFGRRDLDVTTWIVFLVRKGEEKRVVQLGYDYLDLDARRREDYEKEVKAKLATEGGHNLQTYSRRAGHPSESVSFVLTDAPLKMQGDKTFGAESAGRYMAEVVLHELGHAMGHVHYDDDPDSKAHDEKGIMTPAKVLGSAGPYVASSFSSASAERIRKRLEWLAGRIAARSKAP